MLELKQRRRGRPPSKALTTPEIRISSTEGFKAASEVSAVRAILDLEVATERPLLTDEARSVLSAWAARNALEITQAQGLISGGGVGEEIVDRVRREQRVFGQVQPAHADLLETVQALPAPPSE